MMVKFMINYLAWDANVKGEHFARQPVRLVAFVVAVFLCRAEKNKISTYVDAVWNWISFDDILLHFLLE